MQEEKEIWIMGSSLDWIRSHTRRKHLFPKRTRTTFFLEISTIYCPPKGEINNWNDGKKKNHTGYLIVQKLFELKLTVRFAQLSGRLFVTQRNSGYLWLLQKLFEFSWLMCTKKKNGNSLWKYWLCEDEKWFFVLANVINYGAKKATKYRLEATEGNLFS